MKIIPLSEGTFTIDKTKLFVPFDDTKDSLHTRSAGSLLVEIQPFVVITSKDILLLDTGLGFEKNGTLQLHQNLMDAGINPSEVTKVLMSHLHKDHAGAVGIEREGLGGRLSLPDATYYLQRTELAFADYIHYEITGAHSPHHQVFWIKENGETIFYGADDAPQLQQMKHRFAAKYDYNGKKAMELRQQWWEKGEKEKWTFLFYHDVKNAVWSF